MVVRIICSTEFGSSWAGHLKLLQPARSSVRAAFLFLNATHAWRKACRECQSTSPRTAVFKWTLPTCVTYPTAWPMYTAPYVLTIPLTALFLLTLPPTCACGVVLRGYCGVVLRGYSTTRVLWCSTTRVLWCSATRVLWCSATRVLSRNATRVLWCSTTRVLWCSATRVLWLSLIHI